MFGFMEMAEPIPGPESPLNTFTYRAVSFGFMARIVVAVAIACLARLTTKIIEKILAQVDHPSEALRSKSFVQTH